MKKYYFGLFHSLSLSLYIYIYCHPQTDCFVLSELFSVARHVGHSKPGSKPIQLYVRLSLRPLGQQAYHGWLREFLRYLCTDMKKHSLHWMISFLANVKRSDFKMGTHKTFIRACEFLNEEKNVNAGGVLFISVACPKKYAVLKNTYSKYSLIFLCCQRCHFRMNPRPFSLRKAWYKQGSDPY